MSKEHIATLSPKKLFLIDGAGAFITAFLLFAVLRSLNTCFGMPVKIVILLSAIALLFSIYSIACSFVLKANWRPFLKLIITANSLYCCLTAALLVFYFPQITALGLVYFTGEIAIIIFLISVELKVLKRTLHYF